MIIHRSRPQSGFTQIPDETLRDPRLSWLARGILAEILSRPDDWVTTAEATWRRGRRERGKAGEGRAHVRAAFAELEAAGYLYRRRAHGGRGRVTTELHVFDAPALPGLDGVPVVLTAAAYLAVPVDNHQAADVSAGRTDSHPGGGRSYQAKHASPQVAPTDRVSAVGVSAVGDSAVGGAAVITKTEDGDLNTETLNGNPPDTQTPPVLTSPVPVEGCGAAPGQDQADIDGRGRIFNSLGLQRELVMLGDGTARVCGTADDCRHAAELLEAAL